MVEKINTSQPGAISGEGEDNAPTYVTQEQLNQAINGFRKSFKKDLESVLAAQAAAAAPKEEVSETPTGPKPTVKSLDVEKEEMKKQLKILMDRDAAMRAEMAEQTLNTTLRENFTKHGVDPRHVEHAIAFAKHNKLVKQDEDGNLVMKVNQIDLPLTDAVSQWVKTDDAKLYLAPRGTQGSGQRGPVRAPTNSGTQPQFTQDNVGDFLLDALAKQ